MKTTRAYREEKVNETQSATGSSKIGAHVKIDEVQPEKETINNAVVKSRNTILSRPKKVTRH